jgi:glycosyltransferase involved in cell wall biosynthesis
MRFVRKFLRRKYGWIALHELRNRVLLGHTSVALHRREDAEVRRHAPDGQLAGPALVATIIPTFRRPDHLVQAVRSALEQTVTDQVIVVVDDAGGLPALPADPRLHVITLASNIGVAGISRNIAMRLTDSRYVAFLDDDNEWRPHHLETALARLADTTAAAPAPDAVYTAMRRVTPDGEVRDIVSVPFDRTLAMNQGFLDINTFVARRSPAVRFSRIRRAKAVMPKEDWELIYRYSRRHRVEHIPEVTVEYLVNPDSYWTRWASS